MYLNFENIPGSQSLFLDYLYNFENVSEFYLKNFRDTEAYNEHFNSVLKKHKTSREVLYEIIKKQYSDVKSSDATAGNIELLKNPKTLAVVTGQQLGIGGGPLYTFYKIITVIKLARQLKENYNDFNFVPVFWLEGDDHDFDEVKSLKVYGQDNSVTTITYDDELPEEANRGTIGSKEFNANIENLLNNLYEVLRPSDFKEDLFIKLKTAYFEGTNFKDAFFDLLFGIFDQYGLVIFDPGEISVKKLLADVFRDELTNYRAHADKLVLRSAELEEKYHAQVKIRPINLFIIENNERLAIDPDENGYRIKGKRSVLPPGELERRINERPDKISPNVILRPICQDYLLPTSFYVAGPGEISYFAQIMSLYKDFDIEPPIIYPRSSATILERNVKDILTKYDVSVPEIINNPEQVQQQVVQRLSDIDLNDLFLETNVKSIMLLDELKKQIIGIDPTLADITEKTKERISQTIAALKGKTESAQKRKFETALRQIDKSVLMLYPDKNLQEREINFTYYVNKYGMDIIKWIFNELSINKFEHQILEI